MSLEYDEISIVNILWPCEWCDNYT